MAEIRQGYLDDYTQITNGNIGIGTSISNEKLEIIGGTTAQELNVTGVSTFTDVSGFVKKHTNYTENVGISSGNSGTLSGEVIVGSGLTMTISTDTIAGQGNLDSLKVYNMFQPPSGTTNQRPSGKPGSLFYNFDYKTIEFFDGNSWRQVDNISRAGRGVFAAGTSGPAETRTIDFINIASQGNAQFFGEAFQSNESRVAGTGNEVRGIFAGTNDSSSHDTIEYVTTSSGGNSLDFGNLSEGRGTMGAAASSTRGIFMCGREPGVRNVIDFVEIMTLGNAVDFGDCTEQAMWVSCNNSTTRAIRMGGENSVTPGNQGGRLDTIDFVTISNKGNAVDFGNMSLKRGETASCSNATRGITAGGSPTQCKVIDFITMASEGNAIVFGDLTGRTVALAAGVSNHTRGVIAGGYLSPGSVNAIDFVTFSTTGNAQDFGELTQDRWSLGGASDSHGGLGGF